VSRSIEPETERISERTADLDRLATADLVGLLIGEQRLAVQAAIDATDVIARAVDEIALRLRSGGRLHYAGAGTSGRLGFLDAAEMRPTFGTDRSLVCAHIAGGEAAVIEAIEGAEDDAAAADAAFRDHLRAQDAVIGISASGRAPYVVQALEIARELGAYTVAIVNAADSTLARVAELSIILRTGPEPLAGSTRLKAGTSQKIVLNAISTAVMTRLGRVYQNLMVDVVATNKKRRARAMRLVMRLAPASEKEAGELLAASQGSVKVAVVMARLRLDEMPAREVLERHGGSLGAALNQGQ